MLWKECLESRRENFLFQEVVTKVCQKGVVFEERCREEQTSEAYLTHIGPYVVVITSWETKSWDDTLRNHVKNVSVEEYLFFLMYVMKSHVMSWLIPLFFFAERWFHTHPSSSFMKSCSWIIMWLSSFCLGWPRILLGRKLCLSRSCFSIWGHCWVTFWLLLLSRPARHLGAQCISSFSTCPYLIPASLFP